LRRLEIFVLTYLLTYSRRPLNMTIFHGV